MMIFPKALILSLSKDEGAELVKNKKRPEGQRGSTDAH
jgi:hypothetical protein